MSFDQLHPRLQAAIAHRLGWRALRPIQERAAAAVLKGHNAVVLAPTAGGKTEAAVFPVLSGLLSEPGDGLQALYIAPLKALLNNQEDRLRQAAEMVGLRAFVWHGDVGTADRRRFLRDPAELLLTTPESLEGFFLSEKTDHAALFAGLRAVIIDEIHALAGQDRGAHLMSVLERVAACSRHDLQRIGLSATVGNPETILRWMQGTSQRPAEVVEVPRPPAKRQLLALLQPEAGSLAGEAARLARDRKSILFCGSRADAEGLGARLSHAGVEVRVHHSSVSAEEREAAEASFRGPGAACIVSTSTLELGIDVGDLDRVLQVDAPDTVSSFLQRMGRTGRRAGQVANLAFLCRSPDAVLQAVALVRLARAGRVESIELHPRRWSVLLHQLLAMSLAERGVADAEVWAHLQRVPDLKGITRPEFDRLVAWMIRDGALIRSSGRLLLGPGAERRYGRRHFAELYAVFSTPAAYTVSVAGGAPVGTLSQAFVDRLVEGASCFLLAGRPWTPVRIRHELRAVEVTPAAAGRRPTWGGFAPVFLGYALCQEMRQALLDPSPVPWLHPTAAEALAELRASFAGVFAAKEPLDWDDDEIRWWTFAGGRVNLTLKHALAALFPDAKIIPDNLALKIRGLDRDAFAAARARLNEPELWEDEALWRDVAEGLPGYRLSKFQPLMPPWVEREVLAEALLDVAGAWAWLSGGEAGETVARTGPVAPMHTDHGGDLPPPPRSLPEVAAPVDGSRLRWVASEEALEAVCAALASEAVIGLDVETTLTDRALCLVQIAGREFTALIDPLQISDLSPLATLLGRPEVLKVIHNATFEKSVLGRYGIQIENIFDTLAVSRRVRGKQPDGHSLKVVCAREIAVEMDKAEQTSDWRRRPLSPRQIAYAALDAEVLLRLHDLFAPLAGRQGALFG